MPPASTDPHLLCRVETRLCLLPLEHVLETMRPLPVEPLAGLPPFVLGLAVIRGSPTPVLDASSLLGGQRSRPTRFITLRAGSRRVALAVDAVLDVRAVPAAALESLPPLLGMASSEVVSAIGTLDGALLLVLRAARLVPEELWPALEGRSATP